MKIMKNARSLSSVRWPREESTLEGHGNLPQPDYPEVRSLPKKNAARHETGRRLDWFQSVALGSGLFGFGLAGRQSKEDDWLRT